HGPTAEGMDWKNQETQYLRFERIANFIDFNRNPSLLDVGCGNSEFLVYCESNKLFCNYLGLDIVEQMVTLSNQRFKKEVAVCGDLFSINDLTKYDYLIASGTFNAKLDANI